MSDTAVQKRGDGSSADGWAVSIFWIVVAIVIGGYYFYEPGADLLLDVATQPERASGRVTFAGQPVQAGVVRVAVYDSGTRRYLASTTLQLDAQGGFDTLGSGAALGIEANSRPGPTMRPLRVSAEFTGSRPADKTADDKAAPVKARPLAGETTLYINSSAPLGKQFLWGLGIVFFALLVLQLWVFTGDLGQRKARTLFVLMYFFTFWALALPLVVSLVVSQNRYLVESMENSPLGLIRAKTTALAEPQWLINIGGVPKPSPIVVNRTEERRSPAVPAGAAAAASEAASTPPAVVVATAEATAAADESGITIQGGVTVPFFMVLLAVFGAGINMTLKVPAIQRAYEDVLSDTRSPTWNPLMATWRLLRGQTSPLTSAVVPQKTAGDIRRDLIENYMYLLSAPLLAIAVYYLLQVLATQVTQPVLVLMALATGLVSKAVIGGLIDFAEDRLLSTKRRDGRAQPGGMDTVDDFGNEARAKLGELQVSQDAAGDARETQAQLQERADAAQTALHEAERAEMEVKEAAGREQASAADVEVAHQATMQASVEAEAQSALAEQARAGADAAKEQAAARRDETDAAIRAVADSAAHQVSAVRDRAAAAGERQAVAMEATADTEAAARNAMEKQAAAADAIAAVPPSVPAVTTEGGSPPGAGDAHDAAPERGVATPIKKD